MKQCVCTLNIFDSTKSIIALCHLHASFFIINHWSLYMILCHPHSPVSIASTESLLLNIFIEFPLSACFFTYHGFPKFRFDSMPGTTQPSSSLNLFLHSRNDGLFCQFTTSFAHTLNMENRIVLIYPRTIDPC